MYKVIELVGSSPESWEKAARAAVDRAGKACVISAWPRWSNSNVINDGKVEAYRAKIKVSFKFEGS